MLDCLSGEDTNKGINITKPLGKYVIYGKKVYKTSDNQTQYSKNELIKRDV